MVLATKIQNIYYNQIVMNVIQIMDYEAYQCYDCQNCLLQALDVNLLNIYYLLLILKLHVFVILLYKTVIIMFINQEKWHNNLQWQIIINQALIQEENFVLVITPGGVVEAKKFHYLTDWQEEKEAIPQPDSPHQDGEGKEK